MLTVIGYEVDLDLTCGSDLFGTTSRVRFTSRERDATTFIEFARPRGPFHGPDLRRRHRFVDPMDDAVYVYSQSFLYDAHRWFACFDQPDLKASLGLAVTAPVGWTVIGNAPGSEESPGRTWRA